MKIEVQHSERLLNWNLKKDKGSRASATMLNSLIYDQNVRELVFDQANLKITGNITGGQSGETANLVQYTVRSVSKYLSDMFPVSHEDAVAIQETLKLHQVDCLRGDTIDLLIFLMSTYAITTLNGCILLLRGIDANEVFLASLCEALKAQY